MTNPNQIWCPLPWTHLSIKTTGALRVCSHSQSGGNKNTILKVSGNPVRIDNMTSDFLNCETLKEIRKTFLHNEWPDQCRRCKIESESGKRSRNQWEPSVVNFTIDDAKKDTLADGTIVNPKVLSMDLRLGNKCNLQCVMCYPGESTQWYPIQKVITGHNSFTIDDVVYSTDEMTNISWAEETKTYEMLADFLPTTKKINFGGGEPFLLKKHTALLQKMIELDLAKDIELEYSTNATFIPNYLLSLFDHFRLIKLCVSIDGVGEVNEAIRFPSKWETIKDTLSILDNTKDNVEVFISSTVSILNVEHIVQLMNWIRDRKFKKINKHVPGSFANHTIMSPKYLSIGLMDEQQHYYMFNYLKTQTNDENILQRLSEWERLSKKLPISNEEIIENRTKLKSFFSTMSSLQNQDWQKVFPICNKMIKDWT